METLMTELPSIIRTLIEDHLAGVPDIDADRKFMEEASKEFYVATVAEAQELLQRLFGVRKMASELDDYCARIGFLRASNALSRAKMGKSWRQARVMSS